MGCGGWAKVPWIAVSDPSESTQHGLYLQFLFRADSSACYLCLGQGTTLLKKAFGTQRAAQHIEMVGEYVKRKCRELLGDDSGIKLDGQIELRGGGGGLAADYEKACVASRIFEFNQVPPEGELLEQLDE